MNSNNEKKIALTCEFALWGGVHRLPFVPIHLLALHIPAETLVEIPALPQLDLPTREQRLVVDEALLVGVDVGDEIAGNEVIDTESVAGIRVGAGRAEQTQKRNKI